MSPVRVALLGYGLAGRVFHRPLLQAAGLEVTAVVTASDERRAQARADLPDCRLLRTAEELWARPGEVDAVVLATPNDTNVPLARTALDLGRAVVVDKPLARTAAEAAGLVAHTRRTGLPGLRTCMVRAAARR